MAATIVWFRNDLRLADHPALHHAVTRGAPVVPVIVWAPEEEAPWEPGGAHRWWLHGSLRALAAALEAEGSRLVLKHGPTLDALREVIAHTGADRVVWNSRHAPPLGQRDERVRQALVRDGLEVRRFEGRLLHDPEAIRTTTGGSYSVFTPFWKNVRQSLQVAEPLPVPRMGARLAPESWPPGVALDAFNLTPEQRDGVDWAGEMASFWAPGEDAAHARLDAFVDEHLAGYADGRNRPYRSGTSEISPYLHHGELSPRQVWQRVQSALSQRADLDGADTFLSEIGWREFAYHVLHHHPHTPGRALREKYDAFPWREDARGLEAWQRGLTGYPIVDAGMRQLWALGWMHNRVRMIVASFLTKDLLVRWQEGAAWFWDTLVDGDLASNTLNWQWSAGSGADAQPFFRIFNPVSQGKKFDPEGVYVRQWVPELRDVPKRYIHAPWEASTGVLAEAGVTLGTTYPHPIVDHAAARERALAAYQTVRSGG